jgi:ribosome-associated protein
MDTPLVVSEGLEIPAAELQWRFGPSGGPGGQHANKAATRAELIFDLANSAAVPEEVKRVMVPNLGKRAPGGVITVVADDSRSQWRNRAIARERLAGLLRDAARRRRRRIATPLPAAARRRRLLRKRRRAETKGLRRRPESE